MKNSDFAILMDVVLFLEAMCAVGFAGSVVASLMQMGYL